MNRIGIVAIIIEEHKKSVSDVNKILSDNSEIICARMGVPNKERDIYVISLIVEATNEQLGGLTGKIGSLEGVTVKSMLTNKTYE